MAKSSVKDSTMVVAHADVGWGNTLYVRGEGNGLSWDKGVPMENKGPSEWVWNPQGSSTFKVLMNDQVWSDGENMTIKNGQKLVLEPSFQ